MFAEAILLILSAAVILTILAINGWEAMGKLPSGERLARIKRSPQFQDGRFKNPQPLKNDYWGMITGLFSSSPHSNPAEPLPIVRPEFSKMPEHRSNGLRVTWFGHSSLLIEIDGHRVLTDPIWSRRSSPLGWIGPQRWHAPTIALEELPELDAVVISHDHYDHMDYATVKALAGRKTKFIVPLGVGSHLAYWGVPESKIIELDWWEEATVRNLKIVATPARHASGRTAVFGIDKTLWSGFALMGSQHRAYFSGDTGLFPAMSEIGERLGPFDVTMIEIGAYGRWWPDWHLGPEQAVKAHQMVRGNVLLPIHWGLFNLAYHGWTEPIERLVAAARKTGAEIVVPKPGQSIDASNPPTLEHWWPGLPWNSAEIDPITATMVN